MGKGKKSKTTKQKQQNQKMRLEEASFLMVGHVHPFQHSIPKWAGKGAIKDPYFVISIPPSPPEEEVARGGKGDGSRSGEGAGKFLAFFCLCVWGLN